MNYLDKLFVLMVMD